MLKWKILIKWYGKINNWHTSNSFTTMNNRIKNYCHMLISWLLLKQFSTCFVLFVLWFYHSALKWSNSPYLPSRGWVPFWVWFFSLFYRFKKMLHASVIIRDLDLDPNKGKDARWSYKQINLTSLHLAWQVDLAWLGLNWWEWRQLQNLSVINRFIYKTPLVYLT